MGRGRNHRKVLERKLGRKLTANEECNHKDGDPSNGDPKNLEALTIHEHNIFTYKGKNALDKWRRKQKC